MVKLRAATAGAFIMGVASATYAADADFTAYQQAFAIGATEKAIEICDYYNFSPTATSDILSRIVHAFGSVDRGAAGMLKSGQEWFTGSAKLDGPEHSCAIVLQTYSCLIESKPVSSDVPALPHVEVTQLAPCTPTVARDH